jgi:hypothetical protein
MREGVSVERPGAIVRSGVTVAPEKGAIMAVQRGPAVWLRSGLSRVQPGWL